MAPVNVGRAREFECEKRLLLSFFFPKCKQFRDPL